MLLALAGSGHASAAQTWIVTNAGDSGPGTLRQAIADAAPGDMIVFDPSLAGATVGLTAGQLVIDKDLVIDGSAAPGVTVSGSNVSRVFLVEADVVAELRSLAIADGKAPDGTIPAGAIETQSGGGIYSDGMLQLVNCTVRDSRAGDGMDDITSAPGGHGGGVYSTGSLTVENSVIMHNRAGNAMASSCAPWICQQIPPEDYGGDGGSGGGIYSTGTLTVISSTIDSNVTGNYGRFRPRSRGGDGGGIYSGGAAEINASTVTANTSGGPAEDCLVWGPFGYESCKGGRGGGIATFAALTIRDSLISHNAAGAGVPGGDGGGIFGTGVIEIVSSTVAQNSAGAGVLMAPGEPPYYSGGNGSGGGRGGGISVYEAEMLVSASEVISNTGGAGGDSNPEPWMREEIPSLVGTRADFTDDPTSPTERFGGNGGTGGHGGGLFAASSDILIDHSSISLNQAGKGGKGGWGWISCGNGGNGAVGGGIRIENVSHVRIHDSALAGNHSGDGGSACPTWDGGIRPGNGGNGGGVYNALSAVEFRNTTISGNYTGTGSDDATDGNGGGIYHEAGFTFFRTSTVADNRASGTGDGGGIWGGDIVILEDTLMSGNRAGALAPECTGPISLFASNVIEDSRDCVLAGNLGAASLDRPALIGPLALNAPGTTPTHALLPHGPAIDAGICSGGLITYDQRGVPRPQGAACDIGAYERELSAEPPLHIYLPLIRGTRS